MTMTDSPTTSPAGETPKVVYQLRRALRLANHLAASYPDPPEALDVAEALPADGWATVAGHAGILEPSADTTALAVELLRHRLGPGEVATEVHMACGHAHRLNDECVVPPDSPRGYLDRALYSTSTDPVRALDRLAALHQLQERLADEEKQAVLGARMAGCDWIQMGEAIGSGRRVAWARWGGLVRRFEAAGLLQPEQLPPPAPPIDSYLAATTPRAWCRWCGNRIVTAGPHPDRWGHHDVHAPAGEGYIDVECPGPEPWPADED